MKVGELSVNCCSNDIVKFDSSGLLQALQKSSASSFLKAYLWFCYAKGSKTQVHILFPPSFELLYISLFLCTLVKNCFSCSIGNGYCSMPLGVTPTVRLDRTFNSWFSGAGRNYREPRCIKHWLQAWQPGDCSCALSSLLRIRMKKKSFY